MGPSSLLLYGEQKCLESKSATGGGFFASSQCCEQNSRLHHLHCKASLIMRNQTQSLAPNWSINNENGLCASCLLSNYPKAGIESRFFASLPEWQAWIDRQVFACSVSDLEKMSSAWETTGKLQVPGFGSLFLEKANKGENSGVCLDGLKTAVRGKVWPSSLPTLSFSLAWSGSSLLKKMKCVLCA